MPPGFSRAMDSFSIAHSWVIKVFQRQVSGHLLNTRVESSNAADIMLSFSSSQAFALCADTCAPFSIEKMVTVSYFLDMIMFIGK